MKPLRLAAAWLLAAAAPLAAAPPDTVAISPPPEPAGAELPPRFVGLSFEVRQVLPDERGFHYFSAENRPLVRLFRSLGVRSLRVGGNTSDRDARRLPERSDLDRLFEFARAAGVKVIYCLRLRGGDPGEDAAVAAYLMGRYADLIDGFSVGQEPSAYPLPPGLEPQPPSERADPKELYPYAAYRAEWDRFARAVVAAAPGIRLTGPDVHDNPGWTRRFIADFGRGRGVAFLTAHLYPGGPGGAVASPEAGRELMLGPGFTEVYRRLHDGFVPAADAAGLPYRLEEVNSFYNGGAEGVSNAFASALWGLDFLGWWAVHGAAGLNFHAGDRVAAGSSLRASRYTPFVTSGDGYEVRPLGYALKAFALLGPGRISEARTRGGVPGLNLSAYALRSPEGAWCYLLVNKEHAPAGRTARLELDAGTSGARAEAVFLESPGRDAAATSGTTLGGAPLGSDGSWNGLWHPLVAGPDGRLAIDLPKATAAVIRFAAP